MSEESNGNQNAALLNKPWFQEAYKSAMEFYTKDDQLDSRDRLELSRTYQSIARAELWGGWFGFSCVFLTPFGYQFYKTNAIRGVKVPRNFMLGLLAMLGSTQLAGNYMYSRKLAALDPDGRLASRNSYGDDDEVTNNQPKSSSQKQYEMMKLLNNGSAGRWAAYFYMTYQNPGRRLPNPKTKLEELKHPGSHKSSFLNQRDPLGLYSGPAFDKKEGIPEVKGKNFPVKSKDVTSGGSTNSWESIRQENNVPGSTWDRVRQRDRRQQEQTGSNRSTADDPEDEDPFATIDHPSQSDFDALLEKERRGEDEL